MSNAIYVVCRETHRHTSGAENVLDQWDWVERTVYSDSPTWVESGGRVRLLPESAGTMLLNDRSAQELTDSGVAGMINALTPHVGTHRVSYNYECDECPTPRIEVKVNYETLAKILDKVTEIGGTEIELVTLQKVLTT